MTGPDTTQAYDALLAARDVIVATRTDYARASAREHARFCAENPSAKSSTP